MTRTLLILGAGGHGKSVAEAALLSGEWQAVCFLDDAWPGAQQALEWPVLGKPDAIADWAAQCDGAVASVGNNRVRQQWTQMIVQAGVPLVSVVHPRAWVSPSAVVGAGSTVMAGAVVGTASTLGEGVIINSNATVDHDVVLGDYAHLGGGVHLAGGVKVGDGAWLQAGSCCGYNVTVPAHTLHGPGSVLG